MSRPSELEQFLQQQVQEGCLDSSGEFTLAREKALEKLAAFQLPRSTSWVLKVVQSAVAGKATAVEIRQTSSDTEFTWDPPEHWNLDLFEQSFHDPEVSSCRAMDHLKRGLWSCSLNEMRPFRLVLPLTYEALVWTGLKFERPKCQPGKLLQLTISHRTLYEGKGLPLLRSIEAARCNAEILDELRRGAYTCPVPLRVDGRRLDNLLACPGHGLSASSYPVKLGFARGQLPALSVPPGTLEGPAPTAGAHQHMQRVFDARLEVPRSVAAACLVSAHASREKSGREYEWRSRRTSSVLYWVLDGVVISQETPGRFESDTAVSCAVFVSADGLGLDLTGFEIRRDEARKNRSLEACRLVEPIVEDCQLCLGDLIASARRGGYLLGVVLFGGGLLVSFASPLHAVFLMGGALYQGATAGSKEQAFEKELQYELERLKQLWKNLTR